MICNHCGQTIKENAVFCSNCGKKAAAGEGAPILDSPISAPSSASHPTYAPAQPVYTPPQPVYSNGPACPQPVDPVIPPEYKPLSAWAYYGYQLLFSIPLVGFILLIVLSCGAKNRNLRNFARSYWCGVLIAFILTLIFIVLAFALGFSGELIDFVESL